MWKIDTTPDTQQKPEDILREQCNLLNEQMKGKVRSNIAIYDKSLSEFFSVPIQSVALVAHALTEPKSIQTILGETGESSTITFELFLSAPAIPSYKYRIMILSHRLAPYPVDLYVEEQVINSTDLEKTCFTAHNEEEFKQFIAKILGSPRISEIIRKMANYR